jgi:NhaP-type Na+/H+ or K+/H+ antiporter
MDSFIRSTSGRLIAFSFALALIGGGASVHLSGDTSLYVMTLSIFAGIVGCVAALQLAVEDFEGASILSSIALPIMLFMYAIGLGVTTAFYRVGSYGFIALGIASLIVGLRSLWGEASEPAPMKTVLRQVEAPAAE